METHLIDQKTKEEFVNLHQSEIVTNHTNKTIITFSPYRQLLSMPPQIEVKCYNIGCAKPYYIFYATHEILLKFLQEFGLETDDLILLQQSIVNCPNIIQNSKIREKYFYMT